MLYRTVNKYCSMFSRGLNSDDIRLFLKSSPSYPGLLSVVQTLRYCGLDVKAVRCKLSRLNELKYPALFHFRHRGRQSLVIVNEYQPTTQTFTLYNPERKSRETKDIEQLGKYWDGAAIYVENTLLKDSRSSVIGTIILLLCIGISLIIFDLGYYIPLIAGLLTGIYQFWHSNISADNMFERLCHISSKTDCSRVEDSAYSSVAGVKMSTLSLTFFAAQASAVIVSLLFGVTDAVYTLYFIGMLVTIPTVCYSIYGQVKVGKICPLCVITLLCIVAESSIFVLVSSSHLNLRVGLLWVILAVAILASLYTTSLSRINLEELRIVKTDLIKLKRRKDILTSESRLVEIEKSPIWLGCENAALNITTVISPGCKHCRNW